MGVSGRVHGLCKEDGLDVLFWFCFFVVVTGSLALRLLSLDVSAPRLCAVLVKATVMPICLLVIAAVWKNKPLSVCLPACLSIYLSVYLFIYLSVSLSVCLSVCLSQTFTS